MKILHRMPHDRDVAHALMRGQVGIAVAHLPKMVGMRFASGEAIAEADIPRLVEDARKGRHMVLHVDALSYRQTITPGTPNRNGIRVAADAFKATATSGAGSVFLQNHEWDKASARGGTVISSELDADESEQRLHQTFELCMPWSVEMALLGILDRLSVGMLRSGAIHCTLCQESIYECWHWPLETIETDEGVQTVEWEFQAAELVETSYVNVPAVVGTEVSLPTIASYAMPKENDDKFEELEARCKALTVELATTQQRADKAEAKLANERREVRDKEARTFVEGLVSNGKLSSATGAMAQHLLSVYAENPEQAKNIAEELRVGPDLSSPQRPTATAADAPATAVNSTGEMTLPRDAGGKVDFKALIDQLPPAVAADLRQWQAKFGANVSTKSMVLGRLDDINGQLSAYGKRLSLKSGRDY